MNKVKIGIGTVNNVEGALQNNTRRVEFVGEKIASLLNQLLWTGEEDQMQPVRLDTTLYRTNNDRLLVHFILSSEQKDMPHLYVLQEVTKADLQPGGRFEKLGAKGDFRCPLTLNEALAEQQGRYSQTEDLLAVVKKLFTAEA